MTFFDWLRGRSSVDLGGECKHVWSNWSAPYDGTQRQAHIISGKVEVVESAASLQSRNCLQCNRVEARVI